MRAIGVLLLSLSVTILPDPPCSRFVELVRLAEDSGFHWAYTYDSHILWQEGCVLVTAAAVQTERIGLGFCVTNPGTREPTVTASFHATLNTIMPPKYASPPPGSPVRSGVVQIAYRNITIQPDAIRVRVGSTLRWTNFDTVQHTVTSRGGPQSFASGKLSPGLSFHIRVQRPGTIHYLCTIHPVTMNGTIEVVR